MDELLHADSPKSNSSIIKRDKKQKSKDPERRKSIIQAVSDFFFKKESSPSPSNQKDKLSMFRLTSKTKGKVRISCLFFSPQFLHFFFFFLLYQREYILEYLLTNWILKCFSYVNRIRKGQM